MSERISATRAGREFSELLDRVHEEGASFVIVGDGEEVARLEPVITKRTRTFRELVETIRTMGPPDEDFANDLEEIHRSQPPLPRNSRE